LGEWVAEKTRDGQPYLSLAFKPKNETAAKPKNAESARPKESTRADFDDEIPF
jgi:hypothetical protein